MLPNSSHACWPFVYPLGKISIQILYPCFNWSVILLLSYKNSIYLDIKLLYIICSAFLDFLAYLSDNVLSCTKVLNFLNKFLFITICMCAMVHVCMEVRVFLLGVFSFCRFWGLTLGGHVWLSSTPLSIETPWKPKMQDFLCSFFSSSLINSFEVNIWIMLNLLIFAS